MKKRVISKTNCRAPITLLLCCIALFFVGCGDGKTTMEGITNLHDAVHDPSQPIVVTKFSPLEGGVGTPILIEGSNFGSDLSIIHVTIEDQVLPVVGCDGSRLYVNLTGPLNDEEGHPLIIRIGAEGKEKEEITAQKFRYVVSPFVSTVAGYKNDQNQSFSRDGKIHEAQFGEINWIEFDQDKNLYILEEKGGLRFIDKDLTQVDTKFTVSNGIDRVRTISFTKDYGKMYITNDDSNDQWQGVGTIELSANDGFVEWKRIINSRFCNGGAIHPVDDEYFFGSYEQGQVFKWRGYSDPMSARENSDELFKIQDKDWEFNIRFHPSGDYAYLVVINKNYILKSYYNWEEKRLEPPVIFAGTPQDKKEYKDGVATNARFARPYQGVFDENGNFYIADSDNHCIRKITPEGIVSTFAGRPTEAGMTDGAIRDAQFNRPQGLAYDEENKVFYVADMENRRLRKITMPK